MLYESDLNYGRGGAIVSSPVWYQLRKNSSTPSLNVSPAPSEVNKFKNGLGEVTRAQHDLISVLTFVRNAGRSLLVVPHSLVTTD